jgi:hypothetical protein
MEYFQLFSVRCQVNCSAVTEFALQYRVLQSTLIHLVGVQISGLHSVIAVRWSSDETEREV